MHIPPIPFISLMYIVPRNKDHYINYTSNISGGRQRLEIRIWSRVSCSEGERARQRQR